MTATAGAGVEAHLRDLEENGYTVLHDAIDPSLLDALSDAIARIARSTVSPLMNNEFVGYRTVRYFNLMAKDPVFEQVPAHPAVVPIMEAVLGDDCLASTLSTALLEPGETAQPFHTDDMLYPYPRPHQPLVCNSMWALTDFNVANGATRVVAGTHAIAQAPDASAETRAVSCEMRRGSVLIWNGSLWHGAGANGSAERRDGLVMNYCAGWVRQQENLVVGTPRERVASFSPQLRRLIGYGMSRSSLGHLDTRAPSDVLF